MDNDKGFKGLDFVGEDGLGSEAVPNADRGLEVPSVDHTVASEWPQSSFSVPNRTETDHFRTCLALGAASSAVVAFLIDAPRSCSTLSLSTGRVG